MSDLNRRDRRSAFTTHDRQWVDTAHFEEDQKIKLAWQKLVRDQAIAAEEVPPDYAFTVEDLVHMEAERIGSMMMAAFDHLTDAQKQELANLTRRQALRYMNGKGLPEIIDGFVKDLVERELAAREEEIRTRVAGEVNARWEAAVAAVVEDRIQRAIAKIKAEFVR